MLLLGAGGAGRAVAFALMDLGVALLRIHDRDADARERSLRRSRRAVRRRPLRALERDPSRPPHPSPASSMPRRSACRAIPACRSTPDLVQPRHFVADVIYTPLETEFLRGARARGARGMGGAGMCVHQAVDAFRLFTGLAPDLGRMHRTFAAAAARRDGASAVTD